MAAWWSTTCSSIPRTTGRPTRDQREWRTVIFGTYREGERGVFALDVTQPDPVEKLNVVDFAGQADTSGFPIRGRTACPSAPSSAAARAGCGTLSYPAQLWEFDDAALASRPAIERRSALGLDRNSASGESSRSPSVRRGFERPARPRLLVVPGQHRAHPGQRQGEDDPVVEVRGHLRRRPRPRGQGGVGNWIYMVDVETGKAIYKRPVAGAVPSEPAAVDTDQDGFLDTLYFGTAGGLLYKVDISEPADVDPATGRIEDTAQWGRSRYSTPRGVPSSTRRPSSSSRTRASTPSRSAPAIAQDLYSPALAGQEGRFYMILDPGFRRRRSVRRRAAHRGSLPADRTLSRRRRPATSSPLRSTAFSPDGCSQLAPNERVVTKALCSRGSAGVHHLQSGAPELCEFGGNGNVYALLATNANSIAGLDEERAIAVEGFAGEPVVTPSGMSTTESDAARRWTRSRRREIQGIRHSLMELFPADCRFGSFSLNVERGAVEHLAAAGRLGAGLRLAEELDGALDVASPPCRPGLPTWWRRPRLRRLRSTSLASRCSRR